MDVMYVIFKKRSDYLKVSTKVIGGIISFLFLLLVILGAISSAKSFEYKKITKTNEVPAIVLNELAKIELKRGLYYFSENFTSEESYLVVCGGNPYSNKYDVDIVSNRFALVVRDNTKSVKQNGEVSPLYGYYEFNFSETKTQEKYSYCTDFSMPFVVFKITSNINYYWVTAEKESGLKINQFWSNDKEYVESKKWSCEVIKDKTDIPEYISINNVIDDESYEYAPFNDSKYGGSTNIIVNQKENEPSFTVSIEAVNVRDQSKYSTDIEKKANIDIVLRKHYGKNSYLHFNSKPYSIIHINAISDFDHVSVSNIIIINDELDWEYIR